MIKKPIKLKATLPKSGARLSGSTGPRETLQQKLARAARLTASSASAPHRDQTNNKQKEISGRGDGQKNLSGPSGERRAAPRQLTTEIFFLAEVIDFEATTRKP
jgi:hypothetical protein